MTSILVRIVRICSSILKCNYLKNEKHFLDFLSHLWNLHQILNIFEKKMIVIADQFSRLQTFKDLVNPLSKKRRFRTSLGSQHVKVSQNTCEICMRDLLSYFFDHSEAKWRWKYLPYRNLKSCLCLLTRWLPMTSIVFGIVRIWSFLFKCYYLKNEKHFLHFLFHLWYLHQILNIFEEKMIMIGHVFPTLLNVKDLLRAASEKTRFRTSLGSQHVKVSQTLVKSVWEIFYHIFLITVGVNDL